MNGIGTSYGSSTKSLVSDLAERRMATRVSWGHSSSRQNPVSLGNKVYKVRVARGVFFANVETTLF